jgi:hypothetical protein
MFVNRWQSVYKLLLTVKMSMEKTFFKLQTSILVITVIKEKELSVPSMEYPPQLLK